MPLLNLSRTLSIPSPPPQLRRAAAGPPPRHRYRVPIVGALWVLSVGAFSALAYKTGCAQSYRRLPLLRPTTAGRSASRGIRSAAAGMEAAPSTVPSIAVYVTVPNKEAVCSNATVLNLTRHFSYLREQKRKKLSESIIKEQLAACVNRIPGVESVYWWDGKVQTDSEELLIIKTRESLLDALTEHVKSNHEYDVPEVIALPIKGGNLKYLEWIKNSTKDN